MSEYKTDANAPINPVINSKDHYLGLSKREYFAAMAMQGFISNGEYRSGGYKLNSLEIASFSCQQADALIKALNAQAD